MIRTTYFAVAITVSIFLNSCSNPMDKEYSRESFQMDIQTMNDNGQLDTLSINLLVDYINSNDSITGTYKKILADAQKQKSKEQEICDIVDQFLTEINDQTKTVNRSNITANFDSTFSKFSSYASKDWKLEGKQENDSVFNVESTSKTHNNLGRPVDIVQRFSLTNIYGPWQIWNSYGLMALKLDFDIVDVDWGFYWDRTKYDILNHLNEKLKLEVIKQGHKGKYYSDFVKGKLRLINDSDYDVKGVKILIEHFDNEGRSVNTDNTVVHKIIRKDGYLEFEWSTYDCSKCASQQFNINYIREY